MKLGIIGAGAIIPFHLEALAAVGFEFSGIAARPNSKRAISIATKYNVPRVFDDFKNLLEMQIDALLIASASETLLEIWQHTIPMQVPTLIEKPVFYGKKQEDFIDSNFENVLVGYNRRFNSSVQYLKNRLKRSSGGTFVFDVPEISWGMTSDKGEVLHNLRTNTVHVIDLIQYVFEDKFDYKISGKSIGVQKNGKALILLEGKQFTGIINLTFGNPGAYSLMIKDDISTFGLQSLENYIEFDSMAIVEPTEEFPIRRYTPISREKTFQLSKDDVIYKPGFLKQSEEFYKIAAGAPREISASIADAAFTCSRIEQIADLLKLI
jgi:predicted dehydrogenase